KRATGRVEVDLEQVYHAKDRIYIRYSVANETTAPFRVTTPDVCVPVPTEQPISLVSLRNHQITSQTLAVFKARQVSGIPVTQAETGTHDLAPGEKTTGVISIESSTGNPPQIYQLNFGADQNGPLTVEAVL
ncbi:MAG: hypothetical protein ACYCSN_21050, partial [Acidobacteriaceae bacterium]